MTFRTFQLNYNEGSITVQLYLEHESPSKVRVDSIDIHSSPREFDTGLPHHATLEFHEKKWKLAAHYSREIEGKIENIIEYLDTIISNDIVNKIMDIMEEGKANFKPMNS